MKRKKLLCIVTTSVLFFACAGLIALCQEYGPDVIYIDDTTKATLRYLPVEFDHQNHQANYDISCVTCHHTNDEDFVSGVPPTCGSCHNMDAEITFKDAMHRNCVLCHMDKIAEGQSPPTECLGCHKQRP
ncbi:MAG: cytochrome c3 family protein [Deltaproteobacteria bacterium]|nr:cytochrome c3 family protein [Candidatus Zymogenaceae bacterium]